MKVRDITSLLEEKIPIIYQEDYDNSGLQVGDPDSEISSILLSLDITPEVIDEAVKEGAGMIISHHPLLFYGLKSISGRTVEERMIIDALRRDIAIYSAHTNLDVIPGGVSRRIASKLGLVDCEPLQPLQGKFYKIAVFVPRTHLEEVRNAMFDAGAGEVGNYDRCSFNADGKGTYRAGEGTDPFEGEQGEDHTADEVKTETIVRTDRLDSVIRSMLRAHPYEEVAYDIHNLENTPPGAGLGCIGSLPDMVPGEKFLETLADLFGCQDIRFSGPVKKDIRKVAVCGGSGASLTGAAIKRGADIFVTGDVKYHTFFENENRMIIADIGHYESEKFSLEILNEIITKKFSKFAVLFSKVNTNPINYLQAWQRQKHQKRR